MNTPITHEDVLTSDYADSRPLSGAIQTLTRLLLHKWLIASVTATFMALGLILAFLLPVRYTAVARILPPKQSPSALSLMLSQPGSGLGSLADSTGGFGLKDPNAIYIGLLKSRPVADKLIQRFDLMKVYRAKDMTGARKTLESYTLIASEKSTLISISVTDRDRGRAAEMANAYAEILRDLTRSVSITEASRRRLALDEQLNDARQSLTTAEVALQQIQQSKGLIHLDTQANAIIGGMASARAEIAAKQVELQALRSYSTEHNPDVQLAEHELSTLQSQASQLEQHSSSLGFSDLGLKDVPRAGLDYVRAAREVQYRQSFFDLVLKQFEAARLDEAKEGAIIQVVEPAIPPDRRSAPKRLILLILFTFFGLFSGYLLVRLQQWYETETADPERARDLLDLKRALLGGRFASRQ